MMEVWTFVFWNKMQKNARFEFGQLRNGHTRMEKGAAKIGCMQ